MDVKSDWITRRLGDVTTLQRGFDLPHRNRVQGSIPIVTSSGIEDFHNVWKAQGPGVITGRYGTIGEVFYVSSYYWPHNTTLYVKDFHGNVPRYIYYLLKTVDFASHSGKSGVPGVNRNDLHQEFVKIPPTLREQEAIAGALSDADAWIESLEQLIAKKRQIKQGAMQELLTGKRRLPGFSGKRAKTTLGELGRWSGGMTPSMANSKYWDGGNFPWVSSGDVKSVKLNDTTQHITTTAIRESATTVMPAGGIIIVNRSGILRRYLPVSLLMRDMAINQDIKGLILKPGLCSEFVLYFILHAGPEILASCMKAGTTVESIELSWLKRFAVQLPNMEEQTAIATVLSDMDTEIESLESKLAKAREIKQGMMQELLTGKIRLV
jgi:type I restriction enzyme S subunit